MAPFDVPKHDRYRDDRAELEDTFDQIDSDSLLYLLVDGSRTADLLNIAGNLTCDTAGLVFDQSTGRVGIGTATPLKHLHIIRSTATVQIENGSSTKWAELNVLGGSAYWAFRAYGATATGTSLGIARPNLTTLASDNSSGIAIYTADPDPLYFGTNDTLALTIDGSTQDVTVAADLAVSGSAAITGGMTVDGTTLVIDQSTGRVGIGTATPLAELHAEATTPEIRAKSTHSAGNAMVRIYNDTNKYFQLLIYGSAATSTTLGLPRASLAEFKASATALVFYTTSGYPLVFGTNTTTALTIDGSTQEVTVAADLAVSGSAAITGGMTVDGTTLVIDQSTGRVGIGTATPGENLDVVGTDNVDLRAKATSAAGKARFFVEGSTGAVLRGTCYGPSATGTTLGYSNAGLMELQGRYASALCIHTYTAYPLILGTGNTVALTIDGSTQEATFAAPFHGTHQLATTTKTADYTATDADCLIDIDHSANDVMITLPAVSGNTGQEYVIGITVNSAYTATIQADGAELINDTNTKVLSMQWDTLRLICNGTIWRIA